MDKYEKLHIKMFDGEGFTIWRYQLEIILEAKEILGIVDGSIPRQVILLQKF